MEHFSVSCTALLAPITHLRKHPFKLVFILLEQCHLSIQFLEVGAPFSVTVATSQKLQHIL